MNQNTQESLKAWGKPHSVTLPLKVSPCYTPRVNELFDMVLCPHLTAGRPGALRIKLRGGKRHPTLADCEVFTPLRSGSRQITPVSMGPIEIQEAFAALCFHLAGSGGLMGCLPRDGMTKPVYLFTALGAIIYDELHAPIGRIAPSSLPSLTQEITIYQCLDPSAHTQLRLHTQMNALMSCLVYPEDGGKVHYKLEV